MRITTTFLPYGLLGIALVSAFIGITGIGTSPSNGRGEALGVAGGMLVAAVVSLAVPAPDGSVGSAS